MLICIKFFNKYWGIKVNDILRIYDLTEQIDKWINYCNSVISVLKEVVSVLQESMKRYENQFGGLGKEVIVELNFRGQIGVGKGKLGGWEGEEIKVVRIIDLKI